MEHYFSSHGLSEGKFKILMFLFDEPGHSLSPTELAKNPMSPKRPSPD